MKKNLHLITLVLLMFLFTGLSAQTYFDVDVTATYKFQHVGTNNLMAFSGAGAKIAAHPDGTADITNEFKIVANANNPGWYNIIDLSDTYYVNSGAVSTTDSYLDKKEPSGDLDAATALFRFRLDHNDGNDGSIWNIQRSFEQKDLNVKNTTDKSTQVGAGNADTFTGNKYQWKIIKNGAVFTDIDDVKAFKNEVYPNPSPNGIFNLEEYTEWTVYSISGTVVEEGVGQQIDLSSSPKGLYILKFDGITKKIMF